MKNRDKLFVIEKLIVLNLNILALICAFENASRGA
jgi:hypothetical protein